MAPAPAAWGGAAAAALLALLMAGPLAAGALIEPVETPMLAAKVAAGELPPVGDRLPREPDVASLSHSYQRPGKPGGEITLLMARAKDLRIMNAYSYARLVAYTPELELKPDILAGIEVEDDRIFTLHLRPGHRWSDGTPFTTEDFRFWWEDVATNAELSPYGPPIEILIEGERPVVQIVDETTVRYTWTRPNPYFLPALAAARPIFIYAPAHYLKKFHAKYAKPDELQQRATAAGVRSWAQLFIRKSNLYEFDNPALPTLQPWMVTTSSPAERFVFVRNPYYHRIDPNGHQLPYLDRVIVQIADGKIIPAKTGAGEADLQARYLHFDNYTFLKAAEARNNYHVRLWRNGYGAQWALYPNLNASDPVWRALFRDVRFRRALSLGIDRDEINQVIYYGLAIPSNDTVLPQSPLFRPEYQTAWTDYDIKQANALLDAIGLTERAGGIRLLPDGRPLQIIIETASEGNEAVDVLELIASSWSKLGIKLFTKPVQLDNLRNRIFAGDTLMTISLGLDNGLATAAMSPAELAPTDQTKYQWPKWGQYHQTGGKAGEAPDMPEAVRLMGLLHQWENATAPEEQAAAWREMLAINVDQVFNIGLVQGVPQPVVVRDTLRNVPNEAMYSWDPGAHFGMYRADSFWLESRD